MKYSFLWQMKLHCYNIMAKISIFIFFFVMLGIPNSIIKLPYGSKSIFCNVLVGLNCRFRYCVSLKDKFVNKFLSLKIRIAGIDTKRGSYPLRIF